MSYQRRVLFQECDPAGILFFARVFDYCHEALQSFLVQKEIGYQDWFSSPEYAIPLVHSEAFFKAPIQPDELLNIEVKVSHLGNSSIQFSYLLKTAAAGVICAECKTAHVFVGKSTLAKIEMPKLIKSKLEF